MENVDVVRGIGNDRARQGQGLIFHDLGVVINNLAVLDYANDGRLRVRSVHPGVSVEEVLESNGVRDRRDGETRLPDEAELHLIRQVVDPRGLREREVPATPVTP
ncbi:hypothetical protein [Streptomyces sp. NPDC055681]